MKRVALFASAFHPSLGGVEEAVWQLATHLERRGVESLVVTNRWPRSLPAEECVRGVRVRRYRFRFPWGGIRARLGFRWLREGALRELCGDLVRFGAQLIHVQCVSANGWYAMQTAHRMALPLVVTSQGERVMDASRVYENAPVFNRVLRACLESAHAVTACSESTLRDLEGYFGGGFGDRGSVIYNGIGEEAFAAGPGWPHPRPYLLALGRLVPQKGFGPLLRAYRAAWPGDSPVDVLLAGEGPEWDELHRLREECRLGKQVHFVGRANRREVGELIRGAVGVVVPSLYEPMGIVALEAMAAGKPLLVSSVGGLREIAPGGDGVRMVEVGDGESLAAGLQWMARCRGQSFSRNRRAAERFRWSAITAQYLEVYRQAAGRRAGEASPREGEMQGALGEAAASGSCSEEAEQEGVREVGVIR